MQISFVLGGGAPCNQTAHFSSVSEQLTPLTPSGATSCSAFVTTDFASLVAKGNGIEQSIIYNAGDGWFTSTFTGTGTATITPYLDPDLTISDSNVLPITGQLTEWFGGQLQPQQHGLTAPSTSRAQTRTGTHTEGPRRLAREHDRGPRRSRLRTASRSRAAKSLSLEAGRSCWPPGLAVVEIRTAVRGRPSAHGRRGDRHRSSAATRRSPLEPRVRPS